MKPSACNLLTIPRKSGKASPRPGDIERQPRASTEPNSSRQHSGQSRPAPREPAHQFINVPRREAPLSDLRRWEIRGPPKHRDFEHEMGPPRSNQLPMERSWQSGGSVTSSYGIDLESRRRSEGNARRPEVKQKSAEFEKYAHKDSETRFELIAGLLTSKFNCLEWNSVPLLFCKLW
jgi:hypothetical protein